MNFAARQHELMERLRWGPSRGPRHKAVLAELRQLVADELRRELAPPRTDLPPPETEAVAPPPGPYGDRTPYWIEQ